MAEERASTGRDPPMTTATVSDKCEAEEAEEARRRRLIESRMLKNRRHYKKDSRFVLDLYTLTFDEDESLDTIGEAASGGGDVPTSLKENASYISVKNNFHDYVSVDDYYVADYRPASASDLFNTEDGSAKLVFSLGQRVDHPAIVGAPQWSSDTSVAPASLQLHQGPAAASYGRSTSVASLETNLHKILARKFAEGSAKEELSFEKAKLLTKAYYQLLRQEELLTKGGLPSGYHSLASYSPHLEPKVSEARPPLGPRRKTRSLFGGKGPVDQQLRWSALLAASKSDLQRIANGLGNTAQALNDYLVDLLVERDQLLDKQSTMLEEISELADMLLNSAE